MDELGRLLGEAGVAAVLIKSGLEGRDPFDDRPLAAVEYGDIDLVAGAEAWDAALSALRRWGRAEAPARFEPHKAIVRPAVGPAAHLHREAEWFGVPVITIEALRARASPMPNGLLLPSPRDAIVLLVAHAVFQTLELTLADLLEMRRLASVGAIDDARIVARAGGWEDAFGHAVRRASATIAALDRGALPAVPVSIAGVPALLDGWRHAANLARRRKPMLALRELALRPCLVAAKVRRAAA